MLSICICLQNSFIFIIVHDLFELLQRSRVGVLLWHLSIADCFIVQLITCTRKFYFCCGSTLDEVLTLLYTCLRYCVALFIDSGLQ
jgi:hypothetical protein